MSLTKCISSHMMSDLLVWRNPNSNEENWVISGGRIENRWTHLGKVVATEIGLCILTTTAAVETIAYQTLKVLSLFLYPVTYGPFNFFAKLLESSSFTMIWGAADLLIFNPFFVNVVTQESFARYWASDLIPAPFLFLRLEDVLYLQNRSLQRVLQSVQSAINNPTLQPIIATIPATQTAIDKGTKFITEEVLSRASESTLNRFKEFDTELYMFILTKAVFIYVAGSKNNEDIPDFFKIGTKELILVMRQELNNEEVLRQLQELTTDPDAFERTPESQAIQEAFNRLRGIAAGELQGNGSLLVTSCWQKAAAKLSDSGDLIFL